MTVLCLQHLKIAVHPPSASAVLVVTSTLIPVVVLLLVRWCFPLPVVFRSLMVYVGIDFFVVVVVVVVVSCLGFAQLFKSREVCLLPNLRNFQPAFLVVLSQLSLLPRLLLGLWEQVCEIFR